jgi:hypothetical protein
MPLEFDCDSFEEVLTLLTFDCSYLITEMASGGVWTNDNSIDVFKI